MFSRVGFLLFQRLVADIEGSVVKRGNLYSFVYYAYAPNGERKQIWESGFKTKKDAEKRQREFNNEFKKRLVSDRKTVADFLKKYISICRKKQLSPNTISGYIVNCRHINSVIGDVFLNEITADMLDFLFDTLSGEGLSGTSCLYIYRTLHSAFELAVKRREIEYNYCDMIDPPKKNKFVAIPIEENHCKTLFSFLDEYDIRYSLPIFLALFLGLRRGEVLGLKWSDIDFEKSVIHIQRTATPCKGGFIFTDCKTEKSNRFLQISSFLIDKINLWRTTQSKFGIFDIDFVFTQDNGKILSATTLNKKFKSVLRSCGIDTTTRFHDLRHTFASYLVNDNVPISVVSQMLGHSKVSTTLDIYTHSDIKQQSLAIKSLEKITTLA